MQVKAKARYIRISPFKLRPLVDVIRGKNAQYALNWLTTAALKRAVPIQKMLQSAVSNAKYLHNVEPQGLIVREVRVDHGPMFKYFKPGAMGRANIQKRRLSHISIILEPIKQPEQKKKEV